MPFLGYIHAEEPDPRPPRRPWEPNWLLWRWILAAAVVFVAAGQTDGLTAAVLALVIFALVCRALLELMPRGDGMNQYRQ